MPLYMGIFSLVKRKCIVVNERGISEMSHLSVDMQNRLFCNQGYQFFISPHKKRIYDKKKVHDYILFYFLSSTVAISYRYT